MAASTSTEVAVPKSVTDLVEQVRRGDHVDLKTITSTLRRTEVLKPPAKLPVPRQITTEQGEALVKVVDLFGGVIPLERRALLASEIADLVEERLALDVVADMATKRKDDIRTTFFNHFDVQAEESGEADPETTDRNADGFYALPAAEAPVHGRTPKREISQGSPSVSIAMLKALADDPTVENFSHADYLECTVQQRVFDEHKFMMLLKKKPELLLAIREAMTPVAKVASFWLRKA